MSQRIRDPRRSRGLSARLAAHAIRRLVALLAVLVIAVPAHAVDYVWNNAAGGDWGTATNWSPNGVPNATTDTATITLAGTYSVVANGSFTVSSLTLGGATGTQTLSLPPGSAFTLNAGGPPATMTVNANGVLIQPGTTLQQGGGGAQVTIAGRHDWSFGAINPGYTYTVAAGGTLALTTAGAKTMFGPVQLVNNGTISHADGGTLIVDSNSTVTNAAGAVFDLQGDARIIQQSGGTSLLNNAGTLRKSSGAGSSLLSLAQIVNTGLIEAQAGSLELSNPAMTVTSSGPGNTLSAQTGASVSIYPGVVGTFAGTTFGGPGAKAIGSGSVPHTYSGTISATNATIVGGVHRGTFALNGELAMSAGVLAQGGSFHMTIPAGATFAFTGSGGKQLLGAGGVTARITNSGTLRFSAASHLLGDEGAFIQNTAGGLIEFVAPGGLVTTGAVQPSVLENLGTVRFATGTQVPVDRWSFVNTGTISVQSGVLVWTGANASFGQTAGRLELAGGDMNNQQHLSISGGVLAGTGTILGPGAVNLSGTAQTRPGTSPGQITIGGPYTQTGNLIVELNGATPGTQYDQVVGQGAVTVGGTLTVALGFVPANGTVFTIIDKQSAGPVTGAFGGLPEGAVFTVSGVQLQISYVGGDGNDVTLTVFQNSGLICTPFTDVDQASPFCPSVQWMKDRAITFGVTPTLYGPANETTRAQMALFMKRLGDTLTDAPERWDHPNILFTGAASEVVCQTGDQAAATYARHLRLDAVLMELGNGTNEFNVEFVASVDAGANWISLAPPVPFGIVNGRWANVRVGGDRDVAAAEVVRYGLRVSRISGSTVASDARCVVRLLTSNRNPSPAPDGPRR